MLTTNADHNSIGFRPTLSEGCGLAKSQVAEANRQVGRTLQAKDLAWLYSQRF